MCVYRLAEAASGERDTRIAMSIVEIHSDTVHDLLSATAYRRLEVKAVRYTTPSPNPETFSHRNPSAHNVKSDMSMLCCYGTDQSSKTAGVGS